VARHVTIGANATILGGVQIGQNAVVGPGAVVTRSVPAHAIVVGNPARITGYVDSLSHDTSGDAKDEPEAPGTHATRVRGVTLHRLPVFRDLRGSLTVAEFPEVVPFVPKRTFMVFDVPSREVRGEHAHRSCHQFLVCIRGSCSVVADDGRQREEFSLDRPGRGVYLPPMTWGIQYKYSHDAALLVFASDAYDPDDYIRDYQEFVEASRGGH
jgi:dTDP-4-dehydrorhamnose 3,5-epimerase-like enzyme